MSNVVLSAFFITINFDTLELLLCSDDNYLGERCLCGQLQCFSWQGRAQIRRTALTSGTLNSKFSDVCSIKSTQ